MALMNTPPAASTAHYSEEAWTFLAEIARGRREYLGLGQEELDGLGGPGKTTVSKIERAAQHGYPVRTYHRLERALGWDRGTVIDILRATNETNFADHRGTIAADLIEADVPDLGGPRNYTAASLSDDELLAELTYRMTRYAREKEGIEHGKRSAEKTDLLDGPTEDVPSNTPRRRRLAQIVEPSDDS